MSESSLRRRLLEEQTSFQALKDELRCQLAKDYLADPDQKIADVAEQLGFTEQSSFGRSFRQWTGYTPRGWREHLASLAEQSQSERTCTKS
jgi:AraC-like DNA-binding protein